MPGMIVVIEGFEREILRTKYIGMGQQRLTWCQVRDRLFNTFCFHDEYVLVRVPRRGK